MLQHKHKPKTNSKTFEASKLTFLYLCKLLNLSETMNRVPLLEGPADTPLKKMGASNVS